MKVYRKKRFSAGHQLKLPYQSKCTDEHHGHDFLAEVFVEGEKNDYGMVMDFEKLGNLIDKLDHKHLNKIFEQPTAENIVTWFIEEISGYLKRNDELRVRIWETENSWAEDETVVE